jgi:6-phosphogluconolactonase
MTEMSNSTATVQTQQPGHVADIENGLTALWRQTVGEGVAVLRATTLNLLIVTDTPNEALDVLKVVAESHPCRAIVIAPDDSAADGPIRATPSLLLHPVFGREMRSQVMCELITLQAGTRAMDRLYSAVQSLTLADQPVFVWHRLPTLTLTDPLFKVLGEGFDTLIVDSSTLTDGGNGLRVLSRLPTMAHFHASISDLNWQRLQGWRSILSQQFEPVDDRQSLLSAVSIEIEHRQAAAGAVLLLGWLIDRLGWRVTASVEPNVWTVRSANGTVRVMLRDAADETLSPGIHSVTIKATSKTYQVMYNEAEGCFRLDSNGHQAIVAASPLDVAPLLNLALDSIGRNPLYEAALTQAVELGITFDQVRQRAGMIFVEDTDSLSRMAAREVNLIARNAIRDNGRFTVALSGGSTPRALYELLATEPFRSELPWAQTHIFWGDERDVPPDHPDSNQRMASEALLSLVPIPPDNIHHIQVGSLSAVDAAARYAAEIRSFFNLSETELPQFDLVLLGLGDDGHTASLFPHTAALKAVGTALFIANTVPQLNTTRLTLTADVINNALHVVFLVSGAKKADILNDVMRGPYVPDDHPAQRIHPAAGSLTIIADHAAAARLRQDN